MNAEIISIGDELTSGERLDTNSQWLSQQMGDLGIRVAFVTSERLYDEQREAITRVFGCPVANGYGGRDAGFIAHACPAGGAPRHADDAAAREGAG